MTIVHSAIGFLLAKFVETVGEDWSNADLEVYLKVDEIKRICHYYFVDHRKQSIFWLHEVANDAIGIPKTVSFGVLCKSTC